MIPLTHILTNQQMLVLLIVGAVCLIGSLMTRKTIFTVPLIIILIILAIGL